MRPGIEVQILGQVFTVVSDDGEEHVRAVAAEVDRRMREVTGRGQPAFTAAVMAALNIASEFQKLQDKYRGIEEKIDHLTVRLAACVAGGGSGEEGDDRLLRAGHLTPLMGTEQGRS